jgi:hypothetical protein
MEAALLYRKCNRLDRALICYSNGLHWMQMIEVSKLLNRSDNDIQININEIYRKLQSNERYSDAAELCLHIQPLV